MANYTITDDVLHSDAAEAYFFRSDSRVLIGLRATCEMLGIPVPDYAVRRKPGPTPGKQVLTAFHADHPAPRMSKIAPRKPNASPEAVAAAQMRQALRMKAL